MSNDVLFVWVNYNFLDNFYSNLKNLLISSLNYLKSSKETRGSYSFSEGANVGLIRVWVFLPIVL